MEDTTELKIIESIKAHVYMIRGEQVMIDSDLAEIYGYELKAMNQQVKRNIERFPEDFMFQLEKEEIPANCLKSQIVTLNENGNKRGMHIKKMPYAFTEQGIYMLATVLKGELATKQSIFIMRAFKEMRHFIANNALMFEKINDIELKQLEYQKDTDEKFGRIFEYMANHKEDNQKIFYDGQIFDAFSFLADIIGHTKALDQEIVALEKDLRQCYLNKDAILTDLDNLDYEDKHYGRRKTDLENRLSRVYDKIEEAENMLVEAKAKKRSIMADKVCGDNIYDTLIYFDKMNAATSSCGGRDSRKKCI